MIISIKQLFRVTVLILSIYFLIVLSTQNAYAETGGQELRNKGQQCVTWVASNEITHRDAGNCLRLCVTYGRKVAKYPDVLTDEGVNKCNEAYSDVEKKVTGIDKSTALVDQAPETIEEMVEDMNIFSKKFQIMMENATTRSEERQANGGYQACERGAKRIQALDVAAAKSYWRFCTGGKRPDGTQGNAE